MAKPRLSIDREVAAQFQARRDRMLARADPFPILLIGLGILAFNIWDRWLDPAGADRALLLRLLTGAALLPFYILLKRRMVGGLIARVLHSAVFLLGIVGVTLAALQLERGFLWGMCGILMFPLALGFYPLPPRWYLAMAVAAMLLVERIAALGGIDSEQRINFVAMYSIAVWAGATALHVLRRQQLRLFLLEQKLAQEARSDSLTGLLNRRRLEQIGGRQCEAAERLHRPLSLLMLDLDHFKRINDRYGHEVGDQALQRSAAALQSSLREVDHLGRWGGEEFLAVLPDTEASHAAVVAERCLKAIRAIELNHANVPIPIRISIGLAERLAGEAFDATVRRADQALYRAKAAGRDRWMAADEG